MPDADAPDHSRFPGRFVQNVLQHHDILALTGGRHHQPLSRLAQREGGIILSGEVRRHDPVDVVAEGSRSDSDRVLGFGAIFRATFPQRGDVFVGQIHIVADVHGPKTSSGGTGAALQKTDLTTEGQTKRESNQPQRGQHNVQIPKGLLINRRADTCSQMSAMALQRTDPVVRVH